MAFIVFSLISDSRSGRGGVGISSPKLTEKNALVLLAFLSASVLRDVDGTPALPAS
jgi:hypothetical protein